MYAPCMPSNLSAGFIILIIISIISVILLIAVAGYFFYKWKINKSGSIEEDRAFNKINF
jgi:flagellar basal body-associated protein FliL